VCDEEDGHTLIDSFPFRFLHFPFPTKVTLNRGKYRCWYGRYFNMIKECKIEKGENTYRPFFIRKQLLEADFEPFVVGEKKISEFVT